VVTQEVRNLASRSAEATNEIKTVVGSTAMKVSKGKKVNSEMIKGYENLNINTNETISLIEDVLSASREQMTEIVRHSDMPKAAFKSLWQTVKKGEIWTGYVKNATKDGGCYWVFATVYPFISGDGSKGFLSCRRKANKEEIAEHEALYKEWKRSE